MKYELLKFIKHISIYNYSGDGDLFNKWIHNSANWDYYEKNNIYTLNFENYVYFWNESTQLENNENSIVLLNKEIYQNKNDKYKILFFNEYERTHFIDTYHQNM